MVFEILQNSETLLVVAILLVLAPFMIGALISNRAEAHLDFFLNLMEGFPKSTES